MTGYSQLPPFDAKGRVQVVIDTPRGSRAKYKYDHAADVFRLSKFLPEGAVFPGNFSFIPGTKGEDGDELDVLILSDEVLALGCVVTVRLIGVLKAAQTEGGRTQRNDRLLGVIETPYNPADLRDLDQLHPQRLDEIEHFFISYNQMQGRTFQPLGRDGAAAALHLVKQHSEVQ